MADKKPSEPVADHLGFAGPWGDAKPGDVLPGISPDPEQRRRDLAAAEAREVRRDIIGDQIAEISAKLSEARDRGDEALVKELRAEQSRLAQMQLSIR
jgi:hypothetical protein